MGSAARRWAKLALYLDEHLRGLLLAAEAAELGRGRVTALSAATGVARTTIQAGMAELSGELAGEGTVSDPGFAAAIEALAEPDAKAIRSPRCAGR